MVVVSVNYSIGDKIKLQKDKKESKKGSQNTVFTILFLVLQTWETVL